MKVGEVIEFLHLPGDIFVVLAVQAGEKQERIICMGRSFHRPTIPLIWNVPYAMVHNTCNVLTGGRTWHAE